MAVPNQVSSGEDGGRVPCLSGCRNFHRTVDQIELAGNSSLLKGAGDHGPGLAQVGLAVFGEQHGEIRLLDEMTGDIVFGLELFDLPKT